MANIPAHDATEHANRVISIVLVVPLAALATFTPPPWLGHLRRVALAWLLV